MYNLSTCFAPEKQRRACIISYAVHNGVCLVDRRKIKDEHDCACTCMKLMELQWLGNDPGERERGEIKRILNSSKEKERQ